MAVSGKELATLDFANLIGGPLNAVVEAQAKAAISTANFIKEVGFDKDGKVITTDFSYTKENNDGRKQEFKLSVPFLSMLPVPYIKIDEAIIEFNAKITSTTESSSESTFNQQVDASVGGRYWFVSAKVSSKTSYQKKSANSDREERTFDMHVKVTASNTDMPSGTEKILNMLEESMTEVPEGVQPINIILANTTGASGVYTISGGDDINLVKDTMKVTKVWDSTTNEIKDIATPLTISNINAANKTFELSAAPTDVKIYIE